MANITGFVTLDETYIFEVDADPSASAGTVAPVGSLAIVKATSGLWQKTTAPDTGWALVSSSGSSSNIDGGTDSSVYTTAQVIDGGTP